VFVRRVRARSRSQNGKSQIPDFDAFGFSAQAAMTGVMGATFRLGPENLIDETASFRSRIVFVRRVRPYSKVSRSIFSPRSGQLAQLRNSASIMFPEFRKHESVRFVSAGKATQNLT
jgi:hypothetical protein